MKGIFPKNINQAYALLYKLKALQCFKLKSQLPAYGKLLPPLPRAGSTRLHRAGLLYRLQGLPSAAQWSSRGLLQGLRQQHRAHSTAPLQGLPLPLNWTPPQGKAQWISPQSSVLCLADKKELNSFPDILVKLQHYNYGSKHYQTFWWVFNEKY